MVTEKRLQVFKAECKVNLELALHKDREIVSALIEDLVEARRLLKPLADPKTVTIGELTEAANYLTSRGVK